VLADHYLDRRFDLFEDLGSQPHFIGSSELG